MKDRTSTNYERQSDASLLERFTEGRDERAFAEIVARHGAVVMAACRRRLSNEQDCLDAFQATFLTLVTKAKWIRQRSSVAGWLQRVAVRVSLDLRKKNSRRRIVAEPPDVEDGNSMDIETTLMIEEELARLPANYRNAIVLCHLEGHTGAEAAKILSVPKNTLNSWVVRGRELLRKRLVKQGIRLSLGGLITSCVSLNGSGKVSAALVQETSHAATLYAAGYPLASTTAASLAKATISMMIFNQLTKFCLLSLIAFGMLLTAKPIIQNAAAEFTYYEEFADESALEPWIVAGNTEVTGNGLKLSVVPTDDPTHSDGVGSGALMTLSGIDAVNDFDTASIRMQVGLDADRANNGSANFVGLTWGNDNDGYAVGGIDANGRTLNIGVAAPWWTPLGVTKLPDNLDLFAGDEVMLQFDIQDGLAIYAWAVGTPKPDDPTLAVQSTRDLFPGRPGIRLDFNKAEGFATIRSVTVAPQSIPEPTGLSLAAVGAVGLLLRRKGMSSSFLR